MRGDIAKAVSYTHLDVYKRQGYEVIAVNNGSAALKKIAELKPDLVILDVYMPGYSGLEVCQRLKESQETARCV